MTLPDDAGPHDPHGHDHRARLRVPVAEELARSLAADMTRRAERRERPDGVAPFGELLSTLCQYVRQHSPHPEP